jgi:hypothetical protein
MALWLGAVALRNAAKWQLTHSVESPKRLNCPTVPTLWQE